MNRAFLDLLRGTITARKHWPAQPKAGVHPPRPLTHGWLLPVLIECESRCWGRWEHWTRVMEAGELIEEAIPRIEFEAHSASPARKMHENALNSIPRHGSWQGWSGWTYFDYYLDWLLFAFGHSSQREPPREPDNNASGRLWQTFCVEAMLAWPADLLGDLLADNAHGRHSGFFPTPHNVVEMMCRMNFGDEDCRSKTVCDPCLGTGRMLLHASNYSYRLYGMDINPTVIKAALVNGYCFAPWLVKPFPFFDSPVADEAPLGRKRVNGHVPGLSQGWLFADGHPFTPAPEIAGCKTLINGQNRASRMLVK
jgi:hypothetical protein